MHSTTLQITKWNSKKCSGNPQEGRKRKLEKQKAERTNKK